MQRVIVVDVEAAIALVAAKLCAELWLPLADRVMLASARAHIATL